MSSNAYFERFSFCDEQIAVAPDPELGIVVVIPCFNEPDLVGSLESLWSCPRPSCVVEIVVIINSPIGCDASVQKQNNQTYKDALDWVAGHADPRLLFHILNFPNLPKKHAGVGLSRKIGMDEAARRFDVISKPAGIIVGFDADCRCDPNYFQEIEKLFREQPKCPGCSIYFEHPLEGPLEPNVYEAIAAYELHLRYYNQGLRYAGFPHAFHTVGSSMAVRAGVYKRQGGMNKRQAGEDFYFLHKVIPLGGYSQLTGTRVIPSERPSERVPFGTGKAVLTFLQEAKCPTYALESLLDLKTFFEMVPSLYSNDAKSKRLGALSEAMRTFLDKQDLDKSLKEIRKNTSNEAAFCNRFFRWFNAFMAMKFMHDARDKFYGERNVAEESLKLLQLLQASVPKAIGSSPRELLKIYRDLDRKS